MRLLPRAACAASAGALVSALAAAAAVAQELPSDADTPSDSPSAWNDVWPWLLLGLGVFVLLLLLAFGIGWRRRGTAQPAPQPAPSPADPPPDRPHASTSDIAVLTFPRLQGHESAEHAYAAVRDDVGPQPWLAEVAFIECHHHGRVVMRGMFAGRYVDVDGSPQEAVRLSDPHGGLLDEIRADVPEGSSALVMYAPTDDVDALAEAFRDSGGRLTRHRVSDETAAALEAAVAQAPRAAAPRTVPSDGGATAP
jgi:hypothetical protein